MPSRTVMEEWREEKPLMSDGREGQNSGGKTFRERRGRPDFKPAMISCSEATGRI